MAACPGSQQMPLGTAAHMSQCWDIHTLGGNTGESPEEEQTIMPAGTCLMCPRLWEKNK